VAAVVYLALTVVMTWPLVTGLTRDLPADLGDPVLNCWILGWDLHHLAAFFAGHLTALAGYWHANIFYPAPLALADSEHLTAQALQVLPVYALTGNLVLCYNLLFLSTFVLSGLGMFLLVREVTGRAWPALLAGLVYAFLPYRMAQLPHVQVLSSQWMPFALYGLVRYFETRRRRPLAGAAIALVLQNLSCGYYLIFFTLPLVIVGLAEMGRHRLWRDRRVWLELLVAGLAVIVATLPFLWPYLELRALGNQPWSLQTIVDFSADTWSYATASTRLNLWGPVMHAFPHAEGELFFGVVAWALAIAAFGIAVRAAWRASAGARDPGWVRGLAFAASVALAAYLVLDLVMLVTGSFTLATPWAPMRVTNAGRMLRATAELLIVWLAISRRARAFLASLAGSRAGLFVGLALLAMWLSFGPVLHVGGAALRGAAAYDWLYRVIPGFDGLRVPARYGMIAGLFIAAAAGCGAASLERLRFGRALVIGACALILVEGAALPLDINRPSDTFDHAKATVPYGALPTRDEIPPVDRFVATLPGNAPIVEFPFGEYALERYYMYFSTVHWHPLLNGYSGDFPEVYRAHRAALRYVLTDPDTAWTVLSTSGARYAIVHGQYYNGERAALIERWLVRHGARQVASFDRDAIFVLPPAN
jgi:hypothetical protein